MIDRDALPRHLEGSSSVAHPTSQCPTTRSPRTSDAIRSASNAPSPSRVVRTEPRATYRVQLHAGFTFDDAAALADYLPALGVSHLYLSPILQAAPGSTHGYDVVDPGRLNEELGGESGFERLRRALGERGLGLVVDIVPNHMAVAGRRHKFSLLLLIKDTDLYLIVQSHSKRCKY